MIALGGCLTIVGLAVKAVNDQLADATRVYQVTYTVTARTANGRAHGEPAQGQAEINEIHGASADLTYATQPGDPWRQLAAELPWTRIFNVPASGLRTFLVTAQLNSLSQASDAAEQVTLTCTIEIDGTLVAEDKDARSTQHADGGVSCTHTLD